jgi:hypothetical protein
MHARQMAPSERSDVAQVPGEPVDLDWLLGHLGKRSFGLLSYCCLACW